LTDRPMSKDDAVTLRNLRRAWEDTYCVDFRDGVWSATPIADPTTVLTAEFASGLRTLIQNRHGERASASALPDATLRLLRAEFPGHRIGIESLRGKVRYIARTRHLGLNPHTVITGDLDELAAALAPARHCRRHPDE
jgi:hypothetical protein